MTINEAADLLPILNNPEVKPVRFQKNLNTINQPITRRQFVASTLTAGAAIALMPRTSLRAAETASNKVVLAIAGVHNRGKELINKFSAVPGVEFKYIVDVDSRYLPAAVAIAEKQQGHAPKTENDFRRVLEDKEVDALIIATPDHWHAPMAILGAKAGKHVYVEKPCSHNPHEGELLVEVASKYKRLVQMGSQRRSIGNVQQLVQEIHDGIIGKVFLAQCFYSRRRPADQPTGQLQLGANELARGNATNALHYFETAVKWDPYSPGIRYDLAMVCSQLGLMREAVILLLDYKWNRLETNHRPNKFYNQMAIFEGQHKSQHKPQNQRVL